MSSRKYNTYFGTVKNHIGKYIYVTPPVFSREVAAEMCKFATTRVLVCETHENKIGNKVLTHTIGPKLSWERRRKMYRD
jgi:hypothetical protein